MKHLLVHFTDEEFKKLCKAKAKDLFVYSWHDFIMRLAKGTSVKKRIGK